MATTKKRLNITLTPILEEAIHGLAIRDNVPEATKAAELLMKAIEMEEDAILLEIAEERGFDKDDYISSEEFWKEVDKMNK